MASVEEHYSNLLASYYSWICGDFDANLKKYRMFFGEHGIEPLRSGVAVDLGAGCGFQSIPLAEAGFNVISIDTNQALLTQLKKGAKNLTITAIQDDLLSLNKHIPTQAEVVVCMGDTLTHLETLQTVEDLIAKIHKALDCNGRLILGYRDLTVELAGLDRFIPVRSSSNKIFTCFLEYEKRHVKVHDIVYEKSDGLWHMKKSFYRKLRISHQWTKECIQTAGFTIETFDMDKEMATIVARKK